jgi:hypothetical protein
MPDEPAPDEPTPRLVRPYVARPDGEPAGPAPAGDPASVEEAPGARHRPASEVEATDLRPVDAELTQPEPEFRGGRAGAMMIAVGGAVLVVLAAVVAMALVGARSPAPTAVLTSAPVTDEVSAPVELAPASVSSTPTNVLSTAPPTASPRRAPPPASTPTPTWTPTPPASDRRGPVVSALPGHPCVDLKGNVVAAGTIVRSLACSGSAGQTWTFATDGTVRVDSTWCLAPADGASDAGTLMTIAACGDAPVLQWRVLADTQIWNPTSGLCLTAPAPTGAQLTIDACTDATGQKWTAP